MGRAHSRHSPSGWRRQLAPLLRPVSPYTWRLQAGTPHSPSPGTPSRILLGNERLLHLRQGQLIADDGEVSLQGAPIRDGVTENLLVKRHVNRIYRWQDGWVLTDGGQTYFSRDGLSWTPGRWQALLEARHMLFLPLADADHSVNGDIPDFLYTWIRP